MASFSESFHTRSARFFVQKNSGLLSATTLDLYPMSPRSFPRVHTSGSQRKHGPVGVRDGSATELWFLGVCGFRRAGQRVESESKAITRCRVQAQEFLNTTILSDFCKFIELHVRAFFRNFTFFFEI